ncbi:MAG: cytochrome c oxidase assembly protein [Flavobacteriaceae bacterium]
MTDARQHRGNGRVALVCGVVAAAMLGLAFAAVPLYDLFCSVTGYGGTTQRADGPAASVLDQEIVVRFDANTNGLGWTFRPEQRTVRVRIGASTLVNYYARNDSDRAMTATATFNVSPPAAGAYFNKIECFCFTEQRLEPGEEIHMPVVFFLDPAMVDEEDLEGVTTLTLSYTFFPVRDEKTDKPAGPVVGLSGTDNSKPL